MYTRPHPDYFFAVNSLQPKSGAWSAAPLQYSFQSRHKTGASRLINDVVARRREGFRLIWRRGIREAESLERLDSIMRHIASVSSRPRNPVLVEDACHSTCTVTCLSIAQVSGDIGALPRGCFASDISLCRWSARRLFFYLDNLNIESSKNLPGYLERQERGNVSNSCSLSLS
jgi:hypothetical protein